MAEVPQLTCISKGSASGRALKPIALPRNGKHGHWRNNGGLRYAGFLPKTGLPLVTWRRVWTPKRLLKCSESLGLIRGTARLGRNRATTASGVAAAPQVQTPSGLYVPASAVNPALAQPVAVPSTDPLADTSVQADVAPSSASRTNEALSLETGRQTGQAAETAVQPEVAPATGTGTQTDTPQETSTLVQPEVVPDVGIDPLTGRPELPQTIIRIDPLTGRPELPSVRPLTGRPELPQLRGLTGTPELPWIRLNTPTFPELTTAQLQALRNAPGPFGATGMERAPDATPDERQSGPGGPPPGEGIPPPDNPLLEGPGIARKREEADEPRTIRGRRVEQSVPQDAHPVETGRPLREDEYPRQVVHEEVVLDVDRGDGSVDRVLVDVGDPKVTTADPTPPPAGEHIAGNQRIVASGQTVYGESVNPVLPPRDAAEQHPEGQVEEAVFVTDLDTRETTVHRYREEREAGESLEGQLERLSEEDRQVVAAEPAQQPKYSVGQRIRMTAERLNAEARERAAGAAEGIASGIETSDQLAEAQQRLDNARQRMDAEESARRQALGPRGRAAEDARGKAASLRGTAPAAPERSAAYQKAAKDHAAAEADIQRLKGESPGGVAAAIGRAGATAHRAGSRLSPQFREVINTLAQSGAQKNAPKTANRRSSGVKDKDLRHPPPMRGSQTIDLGSGTTLTINRGKKRRGGR